MTHCCGKQRSKVGGDHPVPQFSHCWPCRGMENTICNQSRLLVAVNMTRCNRLCEGVCHLPVNQTKNNPTKATSIPYCITTESDALSFETIALDFITKLPE